MERNKAWRDAHRSTKQRNRLKRDFNEHYDKLDCLCYTDRRIQSFMADTPKRCSCWMCGNPRKQGELTRAELRSAQKLQHALTEG